MKLTQINLIIDIPELNNFNIGDKVISGTLSSTEQIEGIVVGIALQPLNSTDVAVPDITLLNNEGELKSGFKPNDLRLLEQPLQERSIGLH
ncbi:hypothetical protein KQ944_05860 [Bacillus subtilis]|uniref:hypothetical protein n=1 Tax=Pseudochrobactrum asaccharolyticum TaxID=354351 RepID=UPI001F3A1C71|nr:hypothetical protein [Pseudochrobactrum asaccharolyticum]MCF7645785.1 hypothetical protein [Pseudochrobactrum asaccharolyticum]MCF7671150.1 hypothetical protein [Bacillus subtilis]